LIGTDAYEEEPRKTPRRSTAWRHDAVRLEVRREADRPRNARALHHLPEPTHVENLRNHKGHSDRKSPYKGVYFDTTRGKWHAQIGVNGKQRFIGRFSNAVDAARAYDAEAMKWFGEFAYLNFPRENNRA